MKVLSALAAGLAVIGLAACSIATAAQHRPHRHPHSVHAAKPCYWVSPDGHVYVQAVPGPSVPRNAFCGQAQPYLAWPGDGGKIWPAARSLPQHKYVVMCSVTDALGAWTVLSEVQNDSQARAACTFVQTTRFP